MVVNHQLNHKSEGLFPKSRIEIYWEEHIQDQLLKVT